MRSLLVTNDFPPKIGGIQSYLGELWRRIPGDETVVFAPAYEGGSQWDALQPWPVRRADSKYMLGAGRLAERIGHLADEVDADVILIDPVIMVGPAMIHRRIKRPDGSDRLWAPILHGAEITVPGRLPGTKRMMRSVLNAAPFVVSAGGYPLAEAERIVGRSLDAIMIPPGVDTHRFVPLSAVERSGARGELDLEPDDLFVLGLSRLVPRKGFDVLIKAAHELAREFPRLVLGIGGSGRDEKRLRRLANSGPGRIKFLGRVPDESMARLYGSCDIFAMLCRNRWLNFEQEGFGIVFLEGAAAGAPAIAGRSGGSHEAVVDGQTGLVVDTPTSANDVAHALRRLLNDPAERVKLGEQGRIRAVEEFDYDVLAARLRQQLGEKVLQYSS